MTVGEPSADGRRVLLITPVRDEADHLELVGRAVAAQTRPPDVWLIVDDGSGDGSDAIARRLAAEIPFATALATPPGYTRDAGDRHAAAAAPRAFNFALRTVEWREFTHLGKLDADIELPPDYFKRLLAEFTRDPRLGIGGGWLVEPDGDGGWRPAPAAREHVRGALKLYARECFGAIGGVQERLGWDGIDESYARMHGFTTRSFETIVARHHRPLGFADGARRGRLRRGSVHWALGYHAPWAALKAGQIALRDGGPVAGATFLAGYLRAAWRREPRIEDPEYRAFIRREQRRRLAAAVRLPAARGRRAPRTGSRTETAPGSP